MSTAQRIWTWLAPYRGWVLLASGLTGLACVLSLQVPLQVQGLIDGVATTGSWNRLPWHAACLLGIFLAQALVGCCNTLVVGHVGQGIVRELRHKLYEHLQRLSLSYFDSVTTGKIIGRMMDDVGAIQTFVTGQTFTILTDLVTTIAISGILVTRDLWLAVVVLGFVPLYALNFRYFMGRIRGTNREIREKMDTLFGHLKEKLDGVQVVKTHAQEAREQHLFREELEDAHVPRVREVYLRSTFANLSAAISGAGTTAVFAIGAWEVLRGRLTPGGVVSTAALASMLFGPIARLADLAYVFEQAGASVDRLGEMLDIEPEVKDPVAPLSFPEGNASGHVEFDRVSFGYQSAQPVVWDIRLDIPPGSKVALVGPTGCGKSTLVSLLLRFYDPSWGVIRLDGVPISQLRQAELRSRMGVVLQEPVLFYGTIRDNIRYGAPLASDEQVERAARAALVHGFASALPQGYDTVIGEGGQKLSQGEQQRVAIARALCLDPSVVILDEATSSLDTPSEALIQAALANLLQGRTSLIIAHRLSTIVDSDLILVMDGGLIVQRGTHAELMENRRGLYYQLCQRQFGDRAFVGNQTPQSSSDSGHLTHQILA